MLVVSAIILSTPLLGRAITPSIYAPEDVVGISEEIYTSLKNVTCDYHSTEACGPLVDQLAGSVVMRVEHAGEMYIIREPYDLPIIQTWIPDGLYSVDNKQYLVKNGYKILLPEGKKLKRLMTVARNGGATGISEEDFAALMTTCESADMNDSCHTAYTRGQEIFAQLQGSIIMRVEHTGELYYINPFNDPSPSAVYPLSNSGNLSVSNTIANNALEIKAAIITEITTGKGKYFKVQ